MWIRKALSLALALLLLAAPAALGASKAVVTNAQTRLYSSASSTASSRAVPAGVGLTLTAYSGGWGRVSYKGKTAYVPLKDVNLKKPVKAYVSRDVTLYRDAGSGSLGTVSKGTEVYFVGLNGSYARVVNRSGTRGGYMDKDALSANSPAAPNPAGARDSRIEQAITVAQSLLGKPYALRANPPSSFNCAAFVHYCYNKAESGSVGATLRDQVHGQRHRKITSISALKRGDLVCFGIDGANDNYGHVGIYLGDGYFIHATATEGQVTVSRLNHGRYKDEFSWGRRIFDS